MRVAVLVNDMAEVNVDAAFVRNSAVFAKVEPKIVRFDNGCICCTLREDLLVEVARLARSGEFDYMIIESTGISEPMQVAETFTFELDKKLRKSSKLKSLADVARLDTCVTVVDGSTFLDYWNSVESMAEVENPEVQNEEKNRDDGDVSMEEVKSEASPSPESEEESRHIIDLLLDQLEFADIVLVNKVDMISSETLATIRATIRGVNTTCRIITSEYGKVDLADVINTKMFSFENAMRNPRWLKELRGEHIPETEEYGISSFVYRRRQPFDREKIFEFFAKFWILEIAEIDDEVIDPIDDDGLAEAGDESEDSDGDSVVDMESERRDRLRNRSQFGHIIRAKGFLWIKDAQTMCEINGAGALMSAQLSERWFADIPQDEWPEELKGQILDDFADGTGDRRQELVFIGQGIRPHEKEITRLLDECFA